MAEPRGNNDQFEQVLKDYYNAVNSVKLPPDKKFKNNGVKKQGPKSRFTPVIKGKKVSGAAFLAVCRGKVWSIFELAHAVFLYGGSSNPFQLAVA